MVCCVFKGWCRLDVDSHMGDKSVGEGDGIFCGNGHNLTCHVQYCIFLSCTVQTEPQMLAGIVHEPVPSCWLKFDRYQCILKPCYLFINPASLIFPIIAANVAEDSEPIQGALMEKKTPWMRHQSFIEHHITHTWRRWRKDKVLVF